MKGHAWQFLVLSLTLLVGCATQPRNINDICAVFREKPAWYRDAKHSYRKWGVPIPVMMAIIHQESSFRAYARPPRKKFLGFIPGPRPSTAYGYAQVLTTTWDHYIRKTGNRGADRDDFADVVDFLGWYGELSSKKCGIAKNDAYHLYLAYHEGRQGFLDRTYRRKEWLLAVAGKVSRRARTYSGQLTRCRGELDREKKGFLFF
jgi:hypothetical protein